jgi:hypothetical protein
LQTIERSLGRGRVSKYETVEEFVAEMDQMWVNARVFNDAGSQLYTDAGVLRREAIHVITKLFPSIPMWNPLSKKAFGAQSVQEMQVREFSFRRATFRPVCVTFALIFTLLVKHGTSAREKRRAREQKGCGEY